MRNLVPVRGSVLCKKVSGGVQTKIVGGFSKRFETVDIYKIVELPVVPSEGFDFKLGDLVVSNSTGDEIEVNPGETVYLFKVENIMCKVEDAREETEEKQV